MTPGVWRGWRALWCPPSGGEDVGIAVCRRRDRLSPFSGQIPAGSIQDSTALGEIPGELELERSLGWCFGVKNGLMRLVGAEDLGEQCEDSVGCPHLHPDCPWRDTGAGSG